MYDGFYCTVCGGEIVWQVFGKGDMKNSKLKYEFYA